MGWFKNLNKIRFNVNLTSLYSWKEVGFRTMFTDLRPDIEFEVDTLKTFEWVASLRKDGFYAKPMYLHREFADGLPEDIIERISVAVQRRAEQDLNEVRRCIGCLEYLEGPLGSDRASWNIYNQSGNRFRKDTTYRMVFALDKTDDKLGIIIASPGFFRDNAIWLGDIKQKIDIHSEPFKSYYQEL